ncbi:sensitive to high expression 9, mitochondrial [Gossypium arboreum]|uniref:Sensitive to high expression 9, mitochondrial n=1 Tax=Gossypium arboreum TaxID=29729 RepID=A0A0B0N9I8_GOSAR|nr:sensitive to high expression 9, mitochondrial [Gossypium arboreum]
MTSEVGEIIEKLKDKKVEYEAIASSDSSVNLEDIDNRIITEVLGLERYGRVRFQRSGVNLTQYFGSAHSNTCLQGVKLKLKFRG